MGRRKKVASGIAGSIVVLLAVIVFVLPIIIRSQAISRVEKTTGRTLRIASVSINPLTWRAEVRGLRLSEKDSAVTFVSFSSVRVSLSPASVFRRAPILREIAVTSPYVRIVRTAPNTFNFSDLMPKEPQPALKKESPARFSLNNITVVRGACDFIDRAIPREKSHRLRDIEVGIPFVSNIPYLADRYVLPRVRATVNGSPFAAEGRLKPFERSAETVFDVNLRDVDLPFYYGYVPATLPFRVDGGKLSTKLEITYRVAAAEKPDLIVAGSAGVRGLAVNDSGGERLVLLPAAYVRVARAAVISGGYDLAEATLDALELFVSRDQSGKWTHQRLFPQKEERAAEKPEPEKSDMRPPVLTLAKGALKRAKLHFSDAVPPGGFVTVITADFGIERFRSDSPVPADFALSLSSERKEAVSLSGTLAAKPLALQGDAALSGIPLEAYYPYLAPLLASPLRGTLSGGAAVGVGGGDVALRGGRLLLTGFGASFGEKEGAKLSRIGVDGIDLSLKERRAEVASVSLAAGSVNLSRAADGKLSPLALLKNAPKTPAAGTKAKRSAQGKGVPPFRYSVKKISGSGLAVTFTDWTREDAPVFPLRSISFSAGPVTGPAMAPIGYRFASLYGSAGMLESAGTLRIDPLRFKGTCRLARIPIRDFEGYFPDDLLITVADGSLDLNGAAEITKGKDGLAGSFNGEAGVRNFHALGAEDEDLLKWESLQLDGISGTLDPPSLRLQEVALNNFYVRVLVDRDGTLNLRNVREQQEQKAAPPAIPPSSPPVAVAAAPAAKPQRAVQVDTVVLQDGVVDFADRHLARQYRSTMVNLGGRISGLSSEAARYADVDLRGNLENHSPLRITGKINPLRDDLFVDLKVSFTDIDLSPMTPYSGTYLGYSVDKGKLFLDLAYRIDQKKLEASNRVFIDQFTFGQAVESDKATNLPVRLAVALLKDRKGEIHLDLPVAGRTDDPKFSIWGVVFQMLKNLLVKAATSPFALLGSVFGGTDDFAGVPFSYGSATLSPAEREKLTRLASVLRDRPALKLEVSGFADREHDPEGYRSELLLRKMKGEKFLEMVRERKALEGKTAETVEITGTEAPKYLKAVYLKEKFPKPRTFIGTVKDIPDPEKRKLILANTVVTDDDLQSLASDRAAAVREFLIGEGKLEPERIFIKGGDVFRKNAREGEPGSRVEFAVAAR